MELIGKQIAIETILGQPPELHYPSWYAAQIEKLPPAPPEYLAEQAGILVTDSDTISRQAAIDALYSVDEYNSRSVKAIKQLPPIQPKRGRWVLVCDNNGMHFICNKCGAWRYHQEQKFCGECGSRL